MPARDISNELLNAYVDGELPADAAAQVATAVACEPALGERVAQLHRLKAAVGAMTPEPPAVAPASPRHARPGAIWPLRTGIAGIAAGLCAAVVWVGFHMIQPADPGASRFATGADLPDDPPAAVLAVHDRWAMGVQRGGQLIAPQRLDWIDERMVANGLRLVSLNAVNLSEDAASALTHMGYLGENACKLSVFFGETIAPETGLALQVDRKQMRAHWQMANMRFELIARDMNPERFTTVALALFEASRHNLPPQPAQIADIAGARQPCLA